VKLSPVLTGMRTYPFVRLAEAVQRISATGVEVIHFGIGEPREETPEFIREALVAALDPLSTYPSAEGLPALRDAIAAWAGRRFGVALDADREVIPTFGSKEAVFLLAQVLDGDVILVPQPAYPVYERGAVFAGKQVVELPLEAPDFLPDLDAIPRDVLARFATTNWAFLAISLALNLLSVWIRSWRWYYLFPPGSRPSPCPSSPPWTATRSAAAPSSPTPPTSASARPGRGSAIPRRVSPSSRPRARRGACPRSSVTHGPPSCC